MKTFFLALVCLFPVALLHLHLETKIGELWSALIVVLILFVGRVALYLYRRSKGVRDELFDAR